jgi:hypothetical protein
VYNIFRRKALAALATLAAATAISITTASANPFEFLGNSNCQPIQQAPAYANPDEDSSEMRADLKRQIVSYRTNEAPGTVIVDTPNTYLYLVMPGGKAMRYGIGVGREGFTWSGVKTIEKKAEWPDWTLPRNDPAPALPAALRRRRRTNRSARAPCISAARSTASTAPTLPPPSATGVFGLHPDGQRGRDRPLQPRPRRHQGRGPAADPPLRRPAVKLPGRP